jgi:chemotaxis protein histidine kinase CheA/PAS domain-containing protein
METELHSIDQSLPIPFAILNKSGQEQWRTSHFSEWADDRHLDASLIEDWAKEAWDHIYNKIERYGLHTIDRSFRPKDKKRDLPCCVTMKKMNAQGDICVEIIDDSRAVQKDLTLQSFAQIIEENNRLLARQKRQLQEVLDCMTHGLFCIDEELKVREPISPSCESRIFGAQILGMNAVDVLYSGLPADELAMVKSAFVATFGEDDIQWELSASDLPNELRIQGTPDSSPLILRVSHTPIWDQSGSLRRVMVLCEDVTREKSLEDGLREERRLKSYQMRILEKMLELDSATIEALLKRTAVLAHGQAFPAIRFASGDLKRDLHTLKGVLRAYGWTEASSAIHITEETLDQLDAAGPTLCDAGWVSLMKPLKEFHTLCAEIALRLFGIEDPAARDQGIDLLKTLADIDESLQGQTKKITADIPLQAEHSSHGALISRLRAQMNSLGLTHRDKLKGINLDALASVNEKGNEHGQAMQELSHLLKGGLSIIRNFLNLVPASNPAEHEKKLETLSSLAGNIRLMISDKIARKTPSHARELERSLHDVSILTQELRLPLLSNRLSHIEAYLDSPNAYQLVDEALDKAQEILSFYLLFLKGLGTESEQSHGIVQTLARFDSPEDVNAQLTEWAQSGSKSAQALLSSRPDALRINSFLLAADLTALSSLSPQTKSSAQSVVPMTPVVSASLEDVLLELERQSEPSAASSAPFWEIAPKLIEKLEQRPFGNLRSRLAQIAVDTSESVDKEVRFECVGSEILFSRKTLEKVYEALVHLMRNAIDHGIESAEERTRAGKDPRGKVRVTASYSDHGMSVVTIEDDGKGIDTQRLTHLAWTKGIINEQQKKNLSAQHALELIFHVGLTTSSNVTDISGRGVGMDAVKSSIASIGGDIEIESVRGKGTTFRIVLPLPEQVAINDHSWRKSG